MDSRSGATQQERAVAASKGQTRPPGVLPLTEPGVRLPRDRAECRNMGHFHSSCAVPSSPQMQQKEKGRTQKLFLT